MLPGARLVKQDVPAGFPEPVEADDNRLTEEGIALGRYLFYDVRLSGNNKISCASCHLQERAFTDGLVLSTEGASGTVLVRHAPALMNLAWMDGLFWDGGSLNLESQAFGPLSATDEMNQALPLLIDELKSVPDYVNRFRKAFGGEINAAGVVKALAQFQRTFISSNSRYDKYRRKESGVTLSATELNGLQLVQVKCGGCHTGELFTDNSYHNNGLDTDFSNTDHENSYQGRARITYDPADLGKFKTPTLRNSMITAPYMHDGRFNNMEQVLNHYAQGVNITNTTDPLLQQPDGRPGVPLSETDKKNIIAFLHTLTDTTFINNDKFSSPFK